jgi:hypothetical protein
VANSLSLNQQVTLSSVHGPKVVLSGVVDGFELADGGYVLHVFIESPEGQG